MEHTGKKKYGPLKGFIEDAKLLKALFSNFRIQFLKSVC
jgi:hypothetical protein